MKKMPPLRTLDRADWHYYLYIWAIDISCVLMLGIIAVFIFCPMEVEPTVGQILFLFAITGIGAVANYFTKVDFRADLHRKAESHAILQALSQYKSVMRSRSKKLSVDVKKRKN